MAVISTAPMRIEVLLYTFCQLCVCVCPFMAYVLGLVPFLALRFQDPRLEIQHFLALFEEPPFVTEAKPNKQH